MHNAFGTCCTECAQKKSTLGMLGWLPSGFGGLGNECFTRPDGTQECSQLIIPPSGTPLPATEVMNSPGETRALSAAGLVLNGLLLAGGVYLWKHQHKVSGGILSFLGFTSLSLNVHGLVTGRPLFGRS